ncbi:carbohydrate sulfotransferase 11-like [Ixodes scapularis]|uniref:carbohydrate sulfotransferase 11-like n=1 Tax=Ixodes scapularis TaxID=6945 RepID=UPI001A9DE60E|nr:carbohydrate sulfotransferase 11-like [Ixodes scapularis]
MKCTAMSKKSTRTVQKIALAVSCAAIVVSLVYFDWLRPPPFFPTPAPGGTPREQTSRRSDDDFEFRARRISKVCRTYQMALADNNRTIQKRNFGDERSTFCNIRECPIMMDPVRKVGYCFISKVASTTVKTIFGLLLNISNTGNTVNSFHKAFHEQVFTVSPMTFLQRSSQARYTRAMFVRHPFERLVSAYVDKALGPRAGNVYFYEKYWNDVPGVRETGRNLTFPEFIDYVLNQTVNQMNSHWAPYYVMCQPCTVKYEVVGKLETASRDFALFLEALDVRPEDIPQENKSGDNVLRKSAREFFKELTFHQVMRLYERFFFDFEMFGYDFKDYLQ